MQNSQGRLKNFGDKNCLSSSFTSSIHPPVEKSNNYVMLESRDQRLPGLRRCHQFATSPGYEVVQGTAMHALMFVPPKRQYNTFSYKDIPLNRPIF